MASILDEKKIGTNPFPLFGLWFEAAKKTDAVLPEAMTLATVGEDGLVAARVVLLKEWDASGLVFFTNYESLKGLHIASNPAVAVVFHWAELQKQIRVQGRVVKTSESDSDQYFRSRPYESQIGAWASPQSQVLSDRDSLEANFSEFAARWPEESSLPRPKQWGGYRLQPLVFEFWQGRPHRLHDRIRFMRPSLDQDWQVTRLAP